MDPASFSSYDVLPEAVLIHRHGRWIYANPAARRMFGAADDELIGRPIEESVDPEYRAAVAARVTGVAAGVATPPLDQRLIRLDGERFFGAVTGTPLGDSTVLIIVRDVTARRALEEQLRATFEQAAFGIIHVAPDGRWLRMNARFAAILGYDSREELIGRRMQELSHEGDLPADLARRARLVAGEIETSSMEKRYIRRDGSAVWTNLTLSLVRTDEGDPDYFIGILEDLTERKRAEERFRYLIQHGSDVILVIDTAGRVSFASETCRTILGLDPEKVIGTPAFDLLHPEDVAPNSRELVKLVAAPYGSRRAMSARVRHGDGSFRTLSVTGVNLTEAPSVGGIVINAHDISESTRLREELEQLRRVESLGRVAASVAHEFNNLLMQIGSLGEAAARKGTMPENLAGAIRNAVTRGRHITTEILRYGQPAALVRESVSLESWLRETLHDLEPLLGARHRVQLVCDEALPDVDLDRAQMAQVIVNLVLNARDAMPGGGTIDVSARHAEGDQRAVSISVHDRGTGIPDELMGRLFEPLFTTKKHGTGLGLPNVQQIVVRHGGRITVDNDHRQGATFTVTIPVHGKAAIMSH